jgi:predicted Zn finger-like uncharacterized protein
VPRDFRVARAERSPEVRVMKLSCDSCGAKYSIADERVAGKLFKIRCKKCSYVIMVRGTAAAAPAPEPTAITAPVSGEWHVVIGEDRLGPLSLDEVLAKRDDGTLDDDSLVWREGFDDWVALGGVDELRRAPAEPTSLLFATTPPAPAPEVADAMRLRNERNESSVLFTLGNLAKLAAPAETRAPIATAGAATSGTAGEGSGLIDIRALASALAPSAVAKPAATTAGTLDDLPVYAAGGFAEPMVLVPNARPRIDRRIVYALAAMVAMLVALGTILLVVLLRDGKTAQAATPASTEQATPSTSESSPTAPSTSTAMASASSPSSTSASTSPSSTSAPASASASTSPSPASTSAPAS